MNRLSHLYITWFEVVFREQFWMQLYISHCKYIVCNLFSSVDKKNMVLVFIL